MHRAPTYPLLGPKRLGFQGSGVGFKDDSSHLCLVPQRLCRESIVGFSEPCWLLFVPKIEITFFPYTITTNLVTPITGARQFSGCFAEVDGDDCRPAATARWLS